MEFLELVRKRHSVRSFLNKPVPRQMLEQCLEAAHLAPSACNAQPWKFIVIERRELIEEITRRVFHSIYSFNRFIKDAGALIAVVSDKEGFVRKAGKYLKGTDYYLIDIGIAAEHLVLQATEFGLGSCWIGWFDEKRLRKLLTLPRRRRIDIIIALGYCKSETPSIKSRKEFSDISEFIQ